MYKIAYLILLLITILTNCNILGKWLRSSGNVESAKLKLSTGQIIGIGAIENRDPKMSYSPFMVRNFQDMIQFELINMGYLLVEVKQTETENDDAKREKEIQDLSKQSVKEEKNEKDTKITSNAEDLLPQKLRTIAGEKAAQARIFGQEENQLSSKQIAKISNERKLDYFIQGAVGNNESGTLLDIDHNALVFLKIYNKQGVMIGVINFTVNGRTLFEAPFLKDVCKRIANHFSEKIKNKG